MAVRRSKTEWKSLIQQWDESGQSAGQFADSHGLKSSTLSWWRWKLARDEPDSALELVTLLPAGGNERPLDRGVARRRRTPRRTSIEIVVPSGVVVRVPTEGNLQVVIDLVHGLVGG